MVSAAAARKTVSVLFCDLADSTVLGERLDPEPLRELLGRWYEEMRIAVERHGGTVEKFVGDAVMAVFGLPRAHEDDALRAVRAALDMQRAVERLNVSLAERQVPELRIRIGINTGEVVTGDEAVTLATGDAVNTAKRLEEAAAAGAILIGAVTERLVRHAARLEAVTSIQAKGKSAPVEAWRVVEAIAGADSFARRWDTPLVGRGDELAVLRGELDACADERSCRLVTIFGAAGVGKTRLVGELDDEARSFVTVLTGRCLPYGDGITFWPLRELIRSLGGDEALLSAVQDEPDGALVLERLQALKGGVASTEELFWAARRLFEALARQRPLLVVFEDVHWAAPTLLDLIEHVSRWSRDAPVLLLCLARPELLEVRPRWEGTHVHLEPLSAGEASQLLDALDGSGALSPELRLRVAEAAQGNPLFAEQLVAMLAEAGSKTITPLPPTIQALLAARLGRLDPVESDVLERAAVVGREFWPAAVAALGENGDESVGTTLLELVRRDLVEPAPSRFRGEDGFRFRHALIREAAYAAAPLRRRALHHEQFADWMAAAVPGAEFDEIRGYHLEQAYRLGAELGEPDSKLSARAGGLLADAGKRAFERDDGPAATNLLLRAHALLPADDPRQLWVLRRAGVALWWSADVDEGRSRLTEQIALAASLGDPVEEWSGRLDLAACDLMTGQNDADGLLEVAELAIRALSPSDRAGLARAWRRVAHARSVKGQYAEAVEAAELALGHARAGGEHFDESRIVDLLGTSLLYGPAPADSAVGRCEQMLAEAEGQLVMTANIAAPLVGLLGMTGDFELARERARLAAGIYIDFGLTLAFAGLTQVTGPMELLANDPVAAEREVRLGLEILEPRHGDGYQQGLLAEVLYRQGRTAEAAACVDVAEERSPPDLVLAQVAWRGVRAKLEQSPALAREAVTIAETTDATNLVADALADLALVLRAAGDDAWDHAARRAHELYVEKANVAGASRVAAIVASGQPE